MGRPRTSNKHLPKYVSIIHGAYWYRGPGQKAVRIAAVGDEVALYKFLMEQASGIAEPVKGDTLNDLFDKYEREIVPTHAPRTQKDYRRHLAVLRRVFGNTRPDDLKPRDIGRFLDVPRGRILRNRQVGVLSAVYSKAVGRWYLAEKNPCIGVERNEARKRTRYVTDAEFAAVRAMMPTRLQIAMDLALLTGQRQGDLLSLKWEQVTEEGIIFQQGKTGKRLMVTMSPALREVLERARKLLPHLPREYVLRTADGTPYTSEGFRAIWGRRMRKAKNGYRKFGKDYAPILSAPFTFHDLRAKSVSDSKTLQEAFERAGHTSMAMTRGVYDRGIRKVEPLK